jgi:hypothetical protein
MLSPVRNARAAIAQTPKTLMDLDTAALELFDAAEAGDWSSAERALAHAQAAAGSVAALENAFTRSGGALENYYQVRNNLGADLIEARAALSTKDRRWLISSADRIITRAGELSQPFAARSRSGTPGAESLLFLARRMRRALVWNDNAGFQMAQDDFRDLWQKLRPAFQTRPPESLRAVDEALGRLTGTGGGTDLKALSRAVEKLNSTKR